ncbi:MAG: dihydroorotate dehydrogenase (quinone) [Candidatus Pacebacteria bacterium]|nr:dihydroorotate dehydrogenase (quinone) [Candidatus Paceibacterota bacterium]
MKLFLRLGILSVSILGMMDAAYLTYEKLSRTLPPCISGFDCGSVLTSSWSSLFGVPLSFFGLVFYFITFIFAALHILEIDHITILNRKLHTHDIQLGLSIFGALFSGYLVFLMGVILQAWCLYCLGSAVACLVLFILNVMQWYLKRGTCSDLCSSPRSVVSALLYQYIFKPLFFLFDAEFVHVSMTTIGKTLGSWGVTRRLVSWMFAYANKTLIKTIDGIRFPNPVGLAAGFDYNAELCGILPSVGFGWHTIGTVTFRPYAGNAKPRLGRFPRSNALLVNKGFKSVGAQAIIQKLEHTTFTIPTGISIGSTNATYASLDDQIADIVSCFKLFLASTIKNAYYELNISCPNTVGGQPFTTAVRLKKLLVALKPLRIKKPVYIKMPIDLSQKESGALLKTASGFSFIKGIIFGNLTKDKKNPDVHPMDTVLWKKSRGNLSGKPTWNRSNTLIAYTKKHYGKRFTIIGTGGIFSGNDAQKKLVLGADLVQLITGMIYKGPQLIGEINHTLAQR